MTNRIEQILAFVNDQPAHDDEHEEESDHDEQEEQDDETTSHVIAHTTNDTQPMQSVSSQSMHPVDDDKQYKSLMRKMNAAKNKSIYPVIIDGKVVNNESELLSLKDNVMSSRREYMKTMRANKIKNTKLKAESLQPIEDTDEYIEEDDALYKKRSIDGIRKNGNAYKVPKTSKKDTNKIYEHVSKDKAVLRALVTSKDDDDFNDITSKSIKDDNIRKIYEQHRDNDIVRDHTWTREDFLHYMERMMKNANEPKKITPKQPQLSLSRTHPLQQSTTRFGLNPLLFKQ